MTTVERKKLVALAIRKLEARLVALKYCEYDGVKSFQERTEESELLRSHIYWASKALLLIAEEELKEVA